MVTGPSATALHQLKSCPTILLYRSGFHSGRMIVCLAHSIQKYAHRSFPRSAPIVSGVMSRRPRRIHSSIFSFTPADLMCKNRKGLGLSMKILSLNE